MDLKELRGRIDEIDEQIVRLFEKRMHVCADIADYKKQKGKAVFDSKREREKMNALVAMAEDDMKRDVFSLFSSIMDLSKSYQTRRAHGRDRKEDHGGNREHTESLSRVSGCRLPGNRGSSLDDRVREALRLTDDHVFQHV